jgi:hypothetical protein
VELVSFLQIQKEPICRIEIFCVAECELNDSPSLMSYMVTQHRFPHVRVASRTMLLTGRNLSR